MSKKQKAQKKSQKTPDRSMEKKKTANFLDAEARLREKLIQRKAEQAYREKNLRRQIVDEFQALSRSTDVPVTNKLYLFLDRYFLDVEFVRQALSSYKFGTDPWAKMIWKMLADNELEAKLNEWRAHPEAIVEKDLAATLADADCIDIPVSLTADGPDWGNVTDERVLSELERRLGEMPKCNLEWPPNEGNVGKNRSGVLALNLILPSGTKVPFQVNLAFEQPIVPGPLLETWKSLAPLPLDPHRTVLETLAENVHRKIDSRERLTWLARILKAAYDTGYWRATVSQDALQQWQMESARPLNPQKIIVDLPPHRPAAPPLQPSESPRDIGTKIGWDIVFDGASKEIEKLKILNLPPLTQYDLFTSHVDLEAMQYLVDSPALSHLKGKTLADYKERDVRTIAGRIRAEIRALRQRHEALGIRTLANIFLSVARLQFDKLEMGTSMPEIRFCLSGYATRWGQYQIEQHNHLDIARDYYLEAIALNMVSGGSGSLFPTGLFFRSFFAGDYVPGEYDQPDRILGALDNSAFQTDATFKTAGRGLLELAVHHFDWAYKWFEPRSEVAKTEVLVRLQQQLQLNRSANLDTCVKAYGQALSRFQSLLQQMRLSPTAHSIAQVGSELREQLEKLGFLISATNTEMAGLLIQASEAMNGFATSQSYEDRRSSAQTAITLLNRLLQYQHDNYTAMWVTYFHPIAENWSALINIEIEKMAEAHSPDLAVHLVEPNISLITQGFDAAIPRIIIRVENNGRGPASRIDLHLTDVEGRVFTPKLREFPIEPGKSKETYVEVSKSDSPVCFDYAISYYDQDGNYCDRVAAEPLCAKALPALPGLDALRNPFIAGPEVTDERMFVGREQILREVFATATNEGGLIMLQGQKRVGKSSFLGFLEKRLESVSPAKGLVPVYVKMLELTAHPAWQLMENIAKSIKSKARTLLNVPVTTMGEFYFRRAYSAAFNDLLKVVKENDIQRVILLIDEFDEITEAIGKRSSNGEDMGYDRLFFSYLRGLSKRRDFTLLVAGGEGMADLFERFGDIFNHDRTWRINYLSPNDGSVERLIRNEYIASRIHFDDRAIDRIKEVTACHPFFLQMLAQELVEAAKRQRSEHVCQLDVDEAVDNMLQHGRLDINHVNHLYKPPAVPDPVAMAIIGIVAELELQRPVTPFVPTKLILDQLLPESEAKAVTRIGDLVRRQILERNPQDSTQVRLMLPIFRDWFYNNQPEYDVRATVLRR